MSIAFKIFSIAIFSIGFIYFLFMILKILFLKFKCTQSVEATIVDMTIKYVHRGGKHYVPTYKYTYNGETYTVKGNNGYVYGPNVVEERMNTIETIMIDENKPTRIYDRLGMLCFLYFMFWVLSSTMLIVSVFN